MANGSTSQDGLDVLAALGVLVGKTPSHADGTMNLLLSHMLDTAAVADVMWERFLAPSTRRLLDEIAGGTGRGRGLFVWLCGVHDCGKATPAFQRRWQTEAAAVRAAGLRWHEPTAQRFDWHHGRAGGHLLQRLLRDAEWPDEQIAWVWPIVAGHHGFFPVASALRPDPRARGQLEGDGRWATVQRALVQRLTEELELGSFADLQPVLVPTRAAQLHLSGFVVMADWIASGSKQFPGVDSLGEVSFAGARDRANKAWVEIGLRGGWGELPEPESDAFVQRFGCEPRPSQVLAVETARQMEAPGLLIVEAPMGDGKTWAGLMAAEVLAAKFGADGVFVGMPEWATHDPMFGQVRRWVSRIDSNLAARVSLLHGKRILNKDWSALLNEPPEARLGAVGECGEPAEGGRCVRGGSGQVHVEPSGSRVPAEWFFGYGRGLLCPFVVAPLDQLLYATTRTKFVMLRMAGLIGKVVVLDEVHATDVYSSQFLLEGLRWFGQAGVPVVLLSATLPAAQRQALVDAYLAGAAGREEYTADDLSQPGGYPSVTAAWSAPEGAGHRSTAPSCASWRAGLPLTVELMPEPVPQRHADAALCRMAQDSADAAVTDRLEEELTHGGCALVIRNSVERAQTLCTALRERFGDEVVLLHEQLPLGTRADRTAHCLHRLAPQQDGPGRERPIRLVVVATQVAEQAFDVDVDLLITDLAPIDLLLQRIGRLHRGDKLLRPARLASPRVIVTGYASGDTTPGADDIVPPAGGRDIPRFLACTESLYDRHLLLRTAALVFRAAGHQGAWSIPADIPALVAAGYGSEDEVPQPWQDAAQSARWRWEDEQRKRAQNASHHLLTRRGDKEGPTLAGLHYVAVPPDSGDSGLTALVQDRDPGVEAVLLMRDGRRYRTLSGSVLAEDGSFPDEEWVNDVLAGTVRLPASCGAGAAEALHVPPAWDKHPWLGRSRVLVLEADGTAVLSGRLLRFDIVLGLVDNGPVV